VIYIPSLVNTGSGIQKLIWRDTQTHRQNGDHISLVLYSYKLGKYANKTALTIAFSVIHGGNLSK
jgi:hypothetical protein